MSGFSEDEAEQMLYQESAKQAGIIKKTYRTGSDQANQACIGEERLQQTQIELSKECPAEAGALTLHGGNQIPSEAITCHPMMTEGEEGETTDDERIEGRVASHSEEEPQPQGQVVQHEAGSLQPLESCERSLAQPVSPTYPHAESGCSETPSSPILVPARVKNAAVANSTKSSAPAVKEPKKRSAEVTEEADVKDPKKRSAEVTEEADESHQTERRGLASCFGKETQMDETQHTRKSLRQPKKRKRFSPQTGSNASTSQKKVEKGLGADGAGKGAATKAACGKKKVDYFLPRKSDIGS